MTHDHVNACTDSADTPFSAVERFLQAVEKRTTDPVHHRLLKKCRQDDPSEALETELRTILSEIVNEA